jgi:hypothetical protein
VDVTATGGLVHVPEAVLSSVTGKDTAIPALCDGIALPSAETVQCIGDCISLGELQLCGFAPLADPKEGDLSELKKWGACGVVA